MVDVCTIRNRGPWGDSDHPAFQVSAELVSLVLARFYAPIRAGRLAWVEIYALGLTSPVASLSWVGDYFTQAMDGLIHSETVQKNTWK